MKVRPTVGFPVPIIAMAVMLLWPAQAGAADWRYADWAARAQVCAWALEDQANPMLEWDVDFAELLGRCGLSGDFDVNSPRVTRLRAGKEVEAPCRFFASEADPSKGRLCWLRLGRMPAETEEIFLVYFDVGTSKPPMKCPELAKAQPVLGINLLANGGLSRSDPKDPSRPAGWVYDPKPPGGTVEWVDAIGPFSKRALRLRNQAGGNTIVSASQQVPVEAGKRYVLGGWIKVEPGSSSGSVGVVGWFSGTKGQAVSGPDGTYSNYKNSQSASGQGERSWTFLAGTTVNVFDPKPQQNRALEEDKLLPGTTMVNVELAVAYGQATAGFTDIELRELPFGSPIAVRAVAVEQQSRDSTGQGGATVGTPKGKEK